MGRGNNECKKLFTFAVSPNVNHKEEKFDQYESYKDGIGLNNTSDRCCILTERVNFFIILSDENFVVEKVNHEQRSI